MDCFIIQVGIVTHYVVVVFSMSTYAYHINQCKHAHGTAINVSSKGLQILKYMIILYWVCILAQYTLELAKAVHLYCVFCMRPLNLTIIKGKLYFVSSYSFLLFFLWIFEKLNFLSIHSASLNVPYKLKCMFWIPVAARTLYAIWIFKKVRVPSINSVITLIHVFDLLTT